MKPKRVNGRNDMNVDRESLPKMKGIFIRGGEPASVSQYDWIMAMLRGKMIESSSELKIRREIQAHGITKKNAKIMIDYLKPLPWKNYRDSVEAEDWDWHDHYDDDDFISVLFDVPNRF